MKKKSIRKKTRVVGNKNRRQRPTPKKTRIATDSSKTARTTAREQVLAANSDAVQDGIVEVIEVWGVESRSEGEVEDMADSGPADSEVSEEEQTWIEP